MESKAIKVWSDKWNMEITEYVRSVSGVELHDAHVEIVKQDLYSYISDASKDAYGSRSRLDVSEWTIAELEAECDRLSVAVGETIDREEAEHVAAEAKFEKNVANLIESGAGDRATAVRWIRDAQDDFDKMYGDEHIKYSLGLSYTYDLDHGDRDYFKRQAAKAA